MNVLISQEEDTRVTGKIPEIRKAMEQQAQRLGSILYTLAFMRSIAVEAGMGFILKQLREMPRFYVDKSNCDIDDGEREEKGGGTSYYFNPVGRHFL